MFSSLFSNRKIFTFLTLFFFLSSTALVAQDADVAATYYKSGMSKYLKGEIFESIRDLEFAQKEDPSFKKTENALKIIYPIFIQKMFDVKNYATAKEYNTKLLTLDKKNVFALDMVQKIKEIESGSTLKDFQKDQTKMVELVEKSDLEKELEQKQEKAIAEGKNVEPEVSKKLIDEQERRVERIIIQTTQSGANNDSAALDSFVETLKDIQKQSVEENVALVGKISSVYQEKEAALEEQRKLREEERKLREQDKFQSRLIIYIMIAIVAIILGWVAWFIVNVFKRRAAMAEYNYKFTAEREQKILEVMNNVVNLDRRADTSFQIGSERQNQMQLDNKPTAQIASNPNSVAPEGHATNGQSNVTSEASDANVIKGEIIEGEIIEGEIIDANEKDSANPSSSSNK